MLYENFKYYDKWCEVKPKDFVGTDGYAFKKVIKVTQVRITDNNKTTKYWDGIKRIRRHFNILYQKGKPLAEFRGLSIISEFKCVLENTF